MKVFFVRMLVSTAYDGPKKPGDELFVPEDTANRWAKLGIAEIIGKEVEDDDVEDEVETEELETEEVEDEIDYNSMTGKALFELCKERGIEVEAKQPKAYYIEKLTNKEEE